MHVFLDHRLAMNHPAIPQQNDVTAEMPQQITQEHHDALSVHILPVALEIQTDPLPQRRDSDRGDDRALIAAIVMAENRRPVDRCPSFSHVWNEQKATLVKEHEVSAQTSGVILYSAKPFVSTLRSRPRRVRSRAARASAMSSVIAAAVADARRSNPNPAEPEPRARGTDRPGEPSHSPPRPGWYAPGKLKRAAASE